MARGIHNIDLHIAILYGGVLGQNGDAALPLQVVGVHHALGYGLILPECAALLEHLVHQRGLSVVDVGDNGYVSQMIVLQGGCTSNLSFYRYGENSTTYYNLPVLKKQPFSGIPPPFPTKFAAWARFGAPSAPR